MGKVDSLRLRDVRNAYRLIGDARDLGDDPALWHRHVLAGLRELVGATHTSGGEGRWCGPNGPVRPLSAFDVTDDAAVHTAFVAYHRDGGQADDPIFRALASVPGSEITCTRRQLVSDADWFRSQSYQVFRQPARIAHELTSVMRISSEGTISVIALNRVIGEADFSGREQRLFNFFHRELARLIGGALASSSEPAPDDLSPRLRQTLSCLIEGDSEKEIAARLNISPITVHQYVTALYRRFGVRSRGQLLAHTFKRLRHERWRRLLADT
jgi:DNA-binding CsgD family transcriptional regulator